jgi:hypothetical protein
MQNDTSPAALAGRLEVPADGPPSPRASRSLIQRLLPDLVARRLGDHGEAVDLRLRSTATTTPRTDALSTGIGP